MPSLLAPPDLAGPARRLADLLAGAALPRPALAFAPLTPRAAPARVVAVDGSHAVLADGKSVLVGAWRAATARAEPGRAPRPEAGAAEVVVVTADDAAATVERALAEADATADVPRDLSSVAALEALRALGEVQRARAAVADLGADDVLLLDGPVAWRAPVPPRALLERLLAEAHARGVHVVGVCKSSALAVGAEPVLAHVRRRARTEAPAGAWLAPLPVAPPRALAVACAARLDAAQRWLFRYDVAPAPGATAADVLGALAPLAGTATYPGYPYPLALAHNAATLPETEARDLREAVRAEALRRGLPAETWDAAFADYHDVLEEGA